MSVRALPPARLPSTRFLPLLGFAAAVWLSACSDGTPQTIYVYLDSQPGETLDATGDTTPSDTSADTSEDTQLIDFGPTVDVEDTGDADWSDLLDPPDMGQDTPDVIYTAPVGNLFAHTKDTLYKLDPDKKAFVLVGKFKFDKNEGLMTDMAIDQYGIIFAVTHDHLFTCDIATAACKWKASLPSPFNAMTFVPKGVLDPAEDVLVGIADEGDWCRIDVTGTTTKITKLGTYGGTWLSSGDAFSVDGIGTYATLKKSNSTEDTLVRVDPKTGKILQFVGGTGVKNLFGLAWWGGVFYGFSSDGNVYELNVDTGKATKTTAMKTPTGVAWWGAGVSTRAAGKITQ
jgi:hypothetical protein